MANFQIFRLFLNNRKRNLILLFLVSSTSLFSQTPKEKIISELLAKMTIEEKVGQMTNLTLATIAESNDNPLQLNMEKLRDAVLKHHVGSFQNVVNHAYTIEEWHNLINTIQEVTLKETTIKIPSLYCIDAVHGTNYTINSTLFPHNLGLAATRNPELVQKCSEITAKEVRASGIRYNFSPVLDIGRQPLWPRFPETFGEDVYLTKTMGVASIKGYEGENLKDNTSVAACMKHFVGYSAPNSGKDRAPASIPEIELREYYLPSFKAAVDAGAHTLMVNSGEVNGMPLHASKYWLTDVLRGELNFKGVIISDWEDVKKLYDRHRICENNKEAVFLSINAGIDLCIVPFDYSFSNDIIALVKEGRITEERINASVKRVLELKYDLGLFENPYVEKEALKNFALPEYKKVALDAARESITLLKNENNVLPLSKNKKVMVIGKQAQSLTALNGAWSYTWQGKKSDYFSKEELTIVNALKKKIGEKQVNYVGDLFSDYSKVEKPDYILVTLGEDAYAETPGNIKTLDLSLKEIDAVNKIKKDFPNTPIVFVLVEGRPIIIREVEPLAQGILLTYWPGSQGANALTDILYGDFNPCGKLPFTYPRYSGELMTYDHKWLDEAIENVDNDNYQYVYSFSPQWTFGHGLSYSSFEYKNLKLNTNTLSELGKLKVSVEVKNTGNYNAKHTVELYCSDLFASITPSVKRLKKFKQITLFSGQTQTVEFELTKEDVAFVSNDLKWITEPGDFELLIDKLKITFTYKK